MTYFLSNHRSQCKTLSQSINQS